MIFSSTHDEIFEETILSIRQNTKLQNFLFEVSIEVIQHFFFNLKEC